MKLTKSQDEALRTISLGVFNHDASGEDKDYEYKRFDAEIIEGTRLLSVVTEVGLIDDEGTMAEVFARTRRHIIVGPNGGMELCNPAKFTKRNGTWRKVSQKTAVRGERCIWHPTTY